MGLLFYLRLQRSAGEALENGSRRMKIGSAAREAVQRYEWALTSTVSQIMAAGIGLLTNVVYLASVGTTGLGHIATALSVALLAMAIVDRGAITFASQQMASEQLCASDGLRVVTSAGAVPALVVAIGGAAALALVGASAWVLGLMCTPFVWMHFVALGFTQGMQWTRLRSGIIAVNAFLTCGLSVLAAALSADAGEFLAVSALAYGISVVPLVASSRFRVSAKQVQWRMGPCPLRLSRRARFPIWLGNLNSYALSAGDVIAASLLIAPSAVGVYQFAKRISQGLLLPMLALVPVLMPRMASAEESSRIRMSVRVVAISLGWSLFLICSVFSTAVLGLRTEWIGPTPEVAAVLGLLIIAAHAQFHREVFGSALLGAARFDVVGWLSFFTPVTAGVALVILRPHGAQDFAFIVVCAYVLAATCYQSVTMRAARSSFRDSVGYLTLLVFPAVVGATLLITV